MFKFPNISRIITEERFWREKSLITFLLLTLFLVVFIVIGFDLLSNIGQKIEQETERKMMLLEIVYWQDITTKYRGYRDGYFELAILAYRLQDREKAAFFLEKALVIDPNFQKGEEFRKMLDER